MPLLKFDTWKNFLYNEDVKKSGGNDDKIRLFLTNSRRKK